MPAGLIRVLGVGLPRTGTTSLQLALERLLGGRCYHMTDVFEHLEHVAVWRRALHGELPDWDAFLADYLAIVDWPGSAFWRELNVAYPEAVVVLSTRADPETWWRSADQTILDLARQTGPAVDPAWLELFLDLLELRLCERWSDPLPAMAAYTRHNAEVQSTIATDRLIVWQPEHGWTPLCRALGTPVPDEPFPHVNTTAEWRSGTSNGGCQDGGGA